MKFSNCGNLICGIVAILFIFAFCQKLSYGGQYQFVENFDTADNFFNVNGFVQNGYNLSSWQYEFGSSKMHVSDIVPATTNYGYVYLTKTLNHPVDGNFNLSYVFRTDANNTVAAVQHMYVSLFTDSGSGVLSRICGAGFWDGHTNDKGHYFIQPTPAADPYIYDYFGNNLPSIIDVTVFIQRTNGNINISVSGAGYQLTYNETDNQTVNAISIQFGAAKGYVYGDLYADYLSFSGESGSYPDQSIPEPFTLISFATGFFGMLVKRIRSKITL